MLFEPIGVVLGPPMNRGRAVATADDTAHGNDHNVDQQVLAVARMARIGQGFEIRTDGTDVDQLGHGEHPHAETMGGTRHSCEDTISMEKAQLDPSYPFMRAGPDFHLRR